MKVILNENVQKLGYRGDIVEVKDGYFRNFLFPKKLAVVATKDKIALAAKRREKMVMEKERLLENVKEVMDKIGGLKLELAAKVTAEGKDTLYAALGEDPIIAAIRAASNVQVEKKHVKISEPIKTIGEHKVIIDFGEKNKVEVAVNVVAE
ncbi:50S ribosomal protein L9 [Candidatus Peregrinibacteria bacterium]|jgi:large subunit ribosomal protein L9|nr:50S ribosomal protein L9 [Candidatus Peregrinibacteria bacterium]MBT4148344.1 50S ribosomal protein L9 [Candidatus Peregrinibacteria bacterium]MBT4366689.1 50S ribosomal protein L9 [Candidatus Peregrinibacteria bacterium]MBT4455903.1 50S ribosomal protein L9 [Candidatus Peregrinibacteria bacterium]